MKNKKTLLIIILVFVLLIGGAYAVYAQVGKTLAPDQLAVQEPQETEKVTDTETENQEQVQEQEQATPLAPDFTVYDIDGNEAHLSDYIGEPIVLNFWASWCGPCQMEMLDFHEKYLELGDAVQFLMVNITTGRETLESASAFIEKNQYTFPVFYDTQSNAAMTYGAYSLPTTYFIDGEGYAVARAMGAIDAATLQRGIDMILLEQ